MAKDKTYQLHLKGYVGGYDFDADYVDYILDKNSGKEVNVLIDSLGGQSNTALSIFSAFKRHGNVNVHFVGMNASAATIASLGAKHISMDASAMYLVHKCSIAFFEWGNLNADDLKSLIDNIEKQKKALDKIDANIAQIYAQKCKKAPADLLQLMKEGGWLNAEEALAWGFVDEITQYEDETAPVLNDNTIQALATAGIPIPNLPKATTEQSAFSKFLNAISAMFKTNDQNYINMKKTFKNICAILKCNDLTSNDGKITLDDGQFESIEDAMQTDKQTIKDLNVRISTLEEEKKSLADAKSALDNEIAELKKKPADTTAHVLDEKNNETNKTDVEKYFECRANAKALFDTLP